MKPPDSFGAAVAEQLEAAANGNGGVLPHQSANVVTPSDGTTPGHRRHTHTHRHSVEDTEIDFDGSLVFNQVLAGIILLSIGAFGAHIYDQTVGKRNRERERGK
jgi:hypothetical protein